jgi:hypothetical protein
MLFNLDATQILRPFFSTFPIILVFPYKKTTSFRNGVLNFRLPVVKVQLTLVNTVTVNPDRNMKNGKFCSQVSTYLERHVGFRNKRD